MLVTRRAFRQAAEKNPEGFRDAPQSFAIYAYLRRARFATNTKPLDAEAVEQKQTTERYTLADLEKWSEVTRDINPPIRLGVFGDPVAP